MPARLKVEEGDIINGLEVVHELPSEYQGKDKKRSFIFKCHCGDVFKSTLNRVKTGTTTSCGCRFKYPTPKHRTTSLKEKLKGTSLIIEDNVSIESGTFRISIQCLKCSNSFCKDFNTLISKPVKCPKCRKKEESIKIEERLLRELDISLEETTLTFYSKCSNEELKTEHDIILKCSDCNKKIKRRFSVARNFKLGCPCKSSNGFDQSSPATLYLLSVKDNAGIVAYKYGITKNLKERVSAIGRKCSYEVSLVKSWSYRSGYQALLHEHTFKKLYKPYLSNEVMGSGNTETFDPAYIDEFLLIQNLQYSNLIGN